MLFLLFRSFFGLRGFFPDFRFRYFGSFHRSLYWLVVEIGHDVYGYLLIDVILDIL